MKLRIKGNSIRLRLQKSEVTNLAGNGYVEEQLQLGPASEQTFVYRLECVDETLPSLSARGIGLTVRIPASWADQLVHTERVGFETEIETATEIRVRVVIEKDFQCLVERPGEDDSDAYDHPNPSECRPTERD